MDGLAELLGRSPELFPYMLDVGKDTLSLIRLTRSDYQKASFLDSRVLTPRTIGRTLPWRQVAASIEAAKLAQNCNFIFHIGHVGSTLLSRLLGAHPAVFALREPQILRQFALIRSEPETQARVWSDDDYHQRLGGCLSLLSRTFEADQSALVKATSFVSELAPGLLTVPSRPKALAMFVSAESYLAAILGGPNSRQEAKVADSRPAAPPQSACGPRSLAARLAGRRRSHRAGLGVRNVGAGRSRTGSRRQAFSGSTSTDFSTIRRRISPPPFGISISTRRSPNCRPIVDGAGDATVFQGAGARL